jgi:hypothetical protein
MLNMLPCNLILKIKYFTIVTKIQYNAVSFVKLIFIMTRLYNASYQKKQLMRIEV